MASPFANNKLLKITPGRISQYIDDEAADSLASRVGRPSMEPERNIIPARFKMYLHQLKISKLCWRYIKERLKDNVFISLKWVMFEFQEIITSPGKLMHNKCKFDFTIKYQLDVDEDFINKVTNNPITYKLQAICNNEELFLGDSQFHIENILELVNLKQPHRILFTNYVLDPSGESIAYLDIWYKFTCKQKMLRTLFPLNKFDKKKSITKMAGLLHERFAQTSDNFGYVRVTDSEFDHFADSLLLVLNRNRVLKTTQSDINNELQERVRWLRFEANWKQTLQENAILHGKKPEEVIWRQWREEDTANVKLRTYDNLKPTRYKPELKITVQKLVLLDGCPALKNDSIAQFYVEYSFLGNEGTEMETPFSMPKRKANEEIVFNFEKMFPIHIRKDRANCKKLAELIRRDDIIKFVVISEPLENKKYPIQTCQELGYAELPFNELIQLEVNVDSYDYELIDATNPIAILGYLTIKVDGILAMRNMALNYMSPKDYKLYM